LLLAPPALAQDSGGVYACVAQALPNLLTRPEVRTLAIQAMECLPTESHLIGAGMAAARSNQIEQMCSMRQSLGSACVTYLDACQAHYADCVEQHNTVLKCLPWTAPFWAALKAAGVDTGEQVVRAALDFRQKSAQCNSGFEYIEEEPPLFWSQSCDDYATSPISFYDINDSYYELRDSGARAEQLRRYAVAAPSGESWQRGVVSLMGLESLRGEDPVERAMGARVLGKHGDFSVSVKFALLEALGDPSASVRAEAALALRTQGNRQPLIVYALLSRLLDQGEPPEVRGSAALAIREQAVEYVCQADEEPSYSDLASEASEDPGQLRNGIPLCVFFDAATHRRAEADGDFLGAAESPSGESRCKGPQDPTHGVFDRYQGPEDLRDFDIAANLCHLNADLPRSRVMRVTRMALLAALEAERDPDVQAKIIAAFRNLISTTSGDGAIVQLLRTTYAKDRDYRVRRATIFALARAARTESWLARELLAETLARDPSPAVRRAAIAAASEVLPMQLSRRDEAFQAYADGVAIHRSRVQSCQTSRSLNIQDATPTDAVLGPFFNLGFKAERGFYQDAACGEAADRAVPVLLRAVPDLAEQEIDLSPVIDLTFSGEVARATIEAKVSLAGPQGSIGLSVDSYGVEPSEATSNPPVTRARMRLVRSLLPAQYYQLRLDAGLKTLAPGEGYREARTILFKTATTTVPDTVATMMTDDPSIDVRYAAAEAFLQSDEPSVRAFLQSRLTVEPARNMARAASYLGSDLLAFPDLALADEQTQYGFLRDVVGAMVAVIDRHEKFLQAQPDAEAYLMIPALTQYYVLMEQLFSKGWLSGRARQRVVDELGLERWLLDKMLPDYPRRPYTQWERQYYPGVRGVWKNILNEHLLTQNAVKDVDHLIYEPLMQSEESD
jgi:hypothetical protein